MTTVRFTMPVSVPFSVGETAVIDDKKAETLKPFVSIQSQKADVKEKEEKKVKYGE